MIFKVSFTNLQRLKFIAFMSSYKKTTFRVNNKH
jgi:hypothetical protein